jgi:two-component system chemotaxis sensor kinase CheA
LHLFLTLRKENTMPRSSKRKPESLGKNRKKQEVEAPAAAEPARPALTPDDVIALLLQLEPTDVSELTGIRNSLASLTETYPNREAEDFFRSALEELDSVIEGTASDPSGSLAAAGRLVEEAGRLPLDSPIAGGATAAAPMPVAAPESAHEPEPPAAPEPAAVATEPAAVAAPQGSPAAESVGAVTLPTDADKDLLVEFLNESRDYIEGAESALLALETDPENMESVNTVFRAFHTIKGTSGFLGLTAISQLAHRAESLLSRVRDREILCTGSNADLALRSSDMLKALMQSVQDALAGSAGALPGGYDALMEELADPEAFSATESAAPRLGDILVAEGKATREAVECVAAAKGEEPIGVAIVKSDTATLSDVGRALRTQKRMGGADSSADSSLRVRTDRLDRLIDMVGELVIAQSMVAQDKTVRDSANHELLKKVTHAGKIVRELQDLSMSMRMVPLKNAFQKMARLTRDLAHKSGKQVSFVSEGEDTEIDRNMVDVLSDPLVHMIRNAIDHGIEPTDVRESCGKPKTGRIRLAAYHSGGNVVVELQDDGRGLNRDRILEKAIARGLVDSEKGLSDSEIFNLIFAPGFSTAEKVTDISGRGVGMDVVKRGVEALRGRVDIDSEFGKGCTFTIRLPLTLAITDGMLVKVGQERYIVPTINIHLSFRPEAQAISTVAGRGEMVMLRGELMPMFRLHRLFGVAGAVESPTEGLLVILGDGNRRCALLVDELLGQQQVVAKALGTGIGYVLGVSGGAILGDGRVGLILDPSEIIALARQAPGLDSNGSKSRPAA